ncbi:flagellar basal body rod protein FlgF [Rugamonas sp.]|uniref:flagellar basal body rod protein FlgF n=1 Tax=Rugamonas sp. TaxID=1926287 RepID=UPI0025F44565|nr:flagellar basal body rod protein FlgF [Rugamonas sp.]
MDALIYTAMSGAETALRGQQVHANNLANLDTGGFRASLALSGSQAVAAGSGVGYDDRHMSQLQANAVSVKAGAMRSTGRDLDVAISGAGFIAVDGPGGEAYSRAGAFNVDADGTLKLNGNTVLGDGGPIVVPINAAIQIGEDGTVSILSPGSATTDMQPIGKIKLVKAEGSELAKNDAGLLVTRNGQPLAVDPTVKLQAGALEGSNVSAVEEMVATMSLNRSFEVQMKMFTTSDTMTQAANKLISGN